MNRQDYLDNLENFIHQPDKFGFDVNIIPVAMWLRNFMPAEDNASHMWFKSSQAIRAALSEIVDVELNDISRLMVLNGYALSGDSPEFPEWAMMPNPDLVVNIDQ